MAVQERKEHAGFEVKPRHHKRGHEEEQRAQLMWINHFALLPGDDSIKTSFNAVTSGVGGGLTGLVISSTTTGEIGDERRQQGRPYGGGGPARLHGQRRPDRV